MAKKYETPNLANMTDTGLVDVIKEWREKEAEAKFYNNFYTEALKARRNDRTEIKGEKYCATFSTTETKRFSTDALRNGLSDPDHRVAEAAKIVLENPDFWSISESVTLRFQELADPSPTADKILGKTPTKNQQDQKNSQSTLTPEDLVKSS